MDTSRGRLYQLSERLSSTQSVLDEDRLARQQTLESRLRHLEDRISQTRLSEDLRFNVLKERIVKLQEDVSAETAARELLEQRKTKEIQLVENSVTLDITRAKQGLQDNVKDLCSYVDENAAQVEDQIAAAVDMRVNATERVNREINDELERIGETVESERRTRETFEQKISRVLTEGLMNVNETLTRERREREDMEQSILKMVEDMCTRFRSDMEAERRDREATEEMLLGLLEDAAARLGS